MANSEKVKSESISNKDKTIKIVMNIFIVILVCMTLYYAVIWFKSDTSGEAGFAVVTGVLIPVVFFIRQKVITLSVPIKDENLKVNIVRKNIRCYH